MAEIKKATTREARKNFAEIINEVAYGHKRIVLTRRGKDLVAMVSLEDLEALETIEDPIASNGGGK